MRLNTETQTDDTLIDVASRFSIPICSQVHLVDASAHDVLHYCSIDGYGLSTNITPTNSAVPKRSRDTNRKCVGSHGIWNAQKGYQPAYFAPCASHFKDMHLTSYWQWDQLGYRCSYCAFGHYVDDADLARHMWDLHMFYSADDQLEGQNC